MPALLRERLSAWEKRVIAYNQKLDEFFDQLPLGMRTLTSDVETKNAEVVSYVAKPNGSFELTLKTPTNLLLLNYTGSEPVRFTRADSFPRIWRPEVHWLHDELEKVRTGVFTHYILLSDGQIAMVTFSDFKLRRLDNEVSDEGRV